MYNIPDLFTEYTAKKGTASGSAHLFLLFIHGKNPDDLFL
jgi:hypothetical protein